MSQWAGILYNENASQSNNATVKKFLKNAQKIYHIEPFIHAHYSTIWNN